MRKKRFGVVTKEAIGLVMSHPVGTRVHVDGFDEEGGTCCIERLDGTSPMVGVPLAYIQLDPITQTLEETGETYAHNFNVHCPMRHEVRLVGHKQGDLDHGRCKQTKDIVGHGDTFEEAALDAWNQKYDMTT